MQMNKRCLVMIIFCLVFEKISPLLVFIYFFSFLSSVLEIGVRSFYFLLVLFYIQLHLFLFYFFFCVLINLLFIIINILFSLV